MSMPIWFFVLWAAASFANAAACLFLWRSKLLLRWPSLFALCADEVLMFCAFQVVGRKYALYMALYYGNAALAACLRIWLAYDVFRDMPGKRHMSLASRIFLVFTGSVAGYAAALLTSPASRTSLARLALDLNRCTLFAWAGMLICLLTGMVFLGFGFSHTGMRVAIGQLVRLLSSMILGFALTSHPTHRQALSFNALDTSVGLLVAVYWARAMYLAPALEAANRTLSKSNINPSLSVELFEV